MGFHTNAAPLEEGNGRAGENGSTKTERHMISSMGSIQPGLILQSYSVAKAP